MKSFLEQRRPQKRSTERRTFLDYLPLEPRQLLAADLASAATPLRTYLNSVPDLSYEHTVVGNYRRDFGSVLAGENVNWQFLWNSPDSWSTHQTGDQSTNDVGEPSGYLPLERHGRLFRPTGVSEPNSASGHLFMTNRGGHTGIHAGLATGSQHDRYAIAAFTVDEAGYYSITDSFVSKNRPDGDAIEVVVHLDGGEELNRWHTAPGAEYRVSFDTNLGFLNAGETIYVGVGAGGDHVQDRFSWNFSITRFSGTVAGHLHSDFSSGFGAGGTWSLLWNATDQLGELPGGSPGLLGDLSAYRELNRFGDVVAASHGLESGNTNLNLHFSSSSDRDVITGHPGSAGHLPNEDRYAIISFTVEHSGYYAITESLLRSTNSIGNGVELLVHNEDSELTYRQLLPAGGSSGFDHSLGYLSAGETVFIATGSNGDDVADQFEIDFKIVSEPLSRPEPVREMVTDISVSVANYGAIPDDGLDDREAIQNAIDDAIAIQQIYRVPVGVELDAGVYRLGAADDTNLRIEGARDIKFSGQGAETLLLLTDPRAALMRITLSEDVFVSDFSIDYETLPFTQGTVVHVLDDFRAVLSVDQGYTAPDDPVLFAPGLTTHRTQFVDSSRSGRLVDGSDFYKSEMELTTANPDGTYTVSYIHELPEALEAGDAWYQIARINERSTFGLSKNRGHMSFVRIDSYAGASGFVQGQFNELVNVIDNRVLFKDGRLVSMAGDAVHVQRSTFGPWVEGNRFVGPSDDVAHVYRFPDTDLGRQLTPDSFEILNRKDLHPGDSVLFVGENGYRQEASIVSRASGVLRVDQPVYGYTADMAVIPLEYVSRGSVFRDNVFALHRAGRGSLVTFSPETTVLGNRFRSINSHAIGVSGYNEFSISDGLLVQGNRFRDIGFKAQLPPVDVAPDIYDLKILDNVFKEVYYEQMTDESGTFHEDFIGDLISDDAAA